MITSLRSITFFLILFIAWPGFGQEGIGRIVALKGEVTASRDNDGEKLSRNLDVGSAVFEKDVIQTSKRSFAVIEFNDQGRIALQSSSVMALTEYQQRRGTESQIVELLKGGLRAVTGAISKARPSAVEYHARGTTIGVRGTTLAIRLCHLSTPQCEFNRAVSERGDIAQNVPETGTQHIFRINEITGQREAISREEFDRLMGATFVGLIEGGILVQSKAGRFELTIHPDCKPGPAGQQNPLGLPCDPETGQPSTKNHQPPMGKTREPKAKIPRPPSTPPKPKP